ncbi:hypothetical protein [Propionivibrio sp.]|uniref:hypothetical protein n=1 Tax=Propionivibrio sp. TaxID=2212460 RepID=UPI003BF0E486
MPPRFICPHCHSPIDPPSMEVASSAVAAYRICPECDELTVVLMISKESNEKRPAPFQGAPSPAA